MKKLIIKLMLFSIIAQPPMMAAELVTIGKKVASTMAPYPKTTLAASGGYALYSLMSHLSSLNHTGDILRAFKTYTFDNINYQHMFDGQVTHATTDDAFSHLYLLSDQDKNKLKKLITNCKDYPKNKDYHRALDAFIFAQIKNIKRMPRAFMASLAVAGINATSLLPQCITAAPWITASLPIVQGIWDRAISIPSDSMKKGGITARKEIQELIDQMRKEKGIEQTVTANVVPKETHHDFSTVPHAFRLLIPSDKLQEITDSLKHDRSLSALHRGSIEHELTHIKRQSEIKKTHAHMIIGVMALGCLAVLTNNNDERTLLGNLLLAACTYLFTKICSTAYERHEEWQSDEGIADNREVLQAQAKDYEDYHKELQAVIKSGSKTSSKNSWFKFLINSGIAQRAQGIPGFYKLLYITHDHPDAQSRAQRFRQRIAEIDRGQQP